MNNEKMKRDLLQMADIGPDEAYNIGYKLGYKCSSETEMFGIENRFEGMDDRLQYAFNQGISIGFIDKCYDMENLDAGVTVH